MENLNTFLANYLDFYLLALIILSGIYITKYTKQIKILNTYKVLISSVIISSVLYFTQGGDLSKYLFTYFFATSFYELIVKFTIGKIESIWRIK